MILIFGNLAVFAQTTAFNYQGKLTDAGTPQANYQMQFKLYDAAVGGTQIGNTISNNSVAVSDGVFSVLLDFGANVFTGANRYLEISVRRNTGENYTILTPRQQIASSPYSIRTLSAQQADTALDSQKLGGIVASEYVTNSTISSSFIRNSTTPQTADFNISGNGIIGGTGIINGNAGVGTNNPSLVSGGTSRLLEIAGTSSPGLAIRNTSAGGGQYFLYSRVDTGISSFRIFDATNNADRFGINNNGNIGVGTTPNNNFRFDSFGPIRAYSTSAAHFVAETTGGTNSWARNYWRSANRSWFMGTSQAFNGDQLYIVDETAGQTRMAISTGGLVGINNTNPQSGLDIRGTGFQVQQRITDNTSNNSLVLQAGSGNALKITGYNYNTSTAVPLYLSTDGANTVLNSGGGNVMQPGAGYGMPKAMVYVNGDGTIIRCYNGITGSSTGNCGFTAGRNSGSGDYSVNFGFQVNNRFYAGSVEGGCCNAAVSMHVVSSGTNSLRIYLFTQGINSTDRPFMLIVY